jgi:RNA polymerase sigma-70 factor (ECF subfamily)
MESPTPNEAGRGQCPEDGNAPEPSDHSLLRRLRAGQEDAATRLYLRYAKRLQALVRARSSAQLARRLEPEDIVQSVFRRFFRRVLQGNYDVPPGEELWGLLLVIALNKIRTEETFHRAGKRDMRLCNQTGNPDRLQTTGDEARLILQLTIQEALGQLPEQSRLLVEMRIDGYEVAEIAQQSGRSKRTVERILQEARTRLRHSLADVEG